MSDLPPMDGTFLKGVRKKRGWSQVQMADYLGCSQGRISKFELGEKIGKPYQKLLLNLVLQPPQASKPSVSP